MNFTAEQNMVESLLGQATKIISEMLQKANARVEQEMEIAFKGTVTTIPEMLVSARGNQTLVAQMLGANRATIKKYARDFKTEHHAIVNGTLMINRGQLGEHKRKNHG